MSPVFLYDLSKELVFVPVASAMTAVHRDRLVLAFYAPRPEIQPLESQDQIVSIGLQEQTTIILV